MTRKHFVMIAQVLSTDFYNASRGETRFAIRNITYSFADRFNGVNVNFNRGIFYTAVFGTSDIDTIADLCKE